MIKKFRVSIFIVLILLLALLTRYWINHHCLNFLVACHCELNTTKPLLLLTFDDGPHPENTPAVLEVLKKHGIFAVFFVNGNKLEQLGKLAKSIVDNGHLLANHSYAHDALIFKSYASIEEDLLRTDSLILQTGESSLSYFRAPFGKSFINLPRVLKNQNRELLGWSIAPAAQFDQAFNAQKVLDQIIDQLHPGAIILLHDGLDNVDPSKLTLLLENLINKSKAKGFQFINSRTSLEAILKND